MPVDLLMSPLRITSKVWWLHKYSILSQNYCGENIIIIFLQSIIVIS
jgi:hypothetical protein